jgi:putative restriction endonuclease
MRLWVGVTDNDWFTFLAKLRPDEVNFWRPGGATQFRAIGIGEPFLFKLHSPQDYIAGGGFLVSHTHLPLSIAWRIFEQKNGCATYPQFRAKILEKRREADLPSSDPVIGCTVLAVPFFFPRQLWIPAPRDWQRQTVQGKGYDATAGIGKELWQQVLDRLLSLPPFDQFVVDIKRKGPLYLVEARQGQGAFRTIVLDAYSRRCAVTGERTIPALEASHIKPYAEAGPNAVNNGLLLRADLHQVFDAGYITLTADYRVEVSKRIREEFYNGREYYRFHGQPLTNLPPTPLERPSKEFIDWHNQRVFRS